MFRVILQIGIATPSAEFEHVPPEMEDEDDEEPVASVEI